MTILKLSALKLVLDVINIYKLLSLSLSLIICSKRNWRVTLHGDLTFVLNNKFELQSRNSK